MYQNSVSIQHKNNFGHHMQLLFPKMLSRLKAQPKKSTNTFPQRQTLVFHITRSDLVLSYFSSGQTHVLLLHSHCFSCWSTGWTQDAVVAWMFFLLWGMTVGKAEHYCHLEFWMRIESRRTAVIMHKNYAFVCNIISTCAIK